MRRFIPFGTAVAVAAASVVLTVPTSSSAAAADRASTAKTTTPFAMRASGYGSRVDGGSVPADSGTTAYQAIGCTNKAGITRRNDVASATLPDVGKVEGIRTRNHTFHNAEKGKTTVLSTHKVAKVELGDSLVLQGVTSKAKAWHAPSGFRRQVEATLVGIKADGETYSAPAPGETLHIPGVARVTLGHYSGFANENGALARANAVKVVLEPSGTVVRIAHSSAQIHRGLEVGRFRGQAFGTQVDALDSNVRSGPQPLSYLPCQGTHGQVRTKSLAAVDLEGQIVVGAVRNDVMGKTVGTKAKKRATGFTQSRIAGITLGPLTVNVIKARANVTRFRSGKLVRNANGTTIGSIVVDGEEQAFPDTEPLVIDGLLELRTNIVRKIKNGIKVTAVRIKLLDGTGATINLGNARLQIKPTGAVTK